MAATRPCSRDPTGLFVSKDAGTTWTRLRGTPFSDLGYVESVVVSPNFTADGTVLVSLHGEGLFKSTDGGATFAPADVQLFDDGYQVSNFYHPTSEPIVFSPNYATDNTVYVFSEEHLFRSTDGQTWKPVEIPVTTHEVSEASAPNRLLSVPRYGAVSVGTGRNRRSSRLLGQGHRCVARRGPHRVRGADLLPVFRKSRFRWLIRIGAGVIVFSGALAVFAIT